MSRYTVSRITLTTSVVALSGSQSFVAVRLRIPRLSLSRKAVPRSPRHASELRQFRLDHAGRNEIYLYFLASDQLEGATFRRADTTPGAVCREPPRGMGSSNPAGSTTGTNGPLQPYLMPWSGDEISDSGIDQSLDHCPCCRSGRGGPAVVAEAAATACGGGNAERAPAISNTPRMDDAGGGRGAPPLEPIDVNAKLVFAGNGYVINKTNIDPYQGVDVHGKIVVVADYLPNCCTGRRKLAERPRWRRTRRAQSAGRELQGF